MDLNILLDSHTFVWFVTGHHHCSPMARDIIEEASTVAFISAASLWEIATKHRIGKWPDAGPLLDKYEALLSRSDFKPLPITLEHARIAGALPGSHKDPFDRMLAAQAQLEQLVLVTADQAFATFGTRTLW